MTMDSLNCRFDNLVTGGDFSDMMNCIMEDMIPAAIKTFPKMVSAKVEAIMWPILEIIIDGII